MYALGNEDLFSTIQGGIREDRWWFQFGDNKKGSFSEDLITFGVDWVRQFWHNIGLRGGGYSRTGEIIRYVQENVGMKAGARISKTAVKWFMEKIIELGQHFLDIWPVERYII